MGLPIAEVSDEPAPGLEKRLVLLLAGGGGAALVLVIMLVILLWPKGGDKTGDADSGKNLQANNNSSASSGAKTVPVDGPATPAEELIASAGFNATQGMNRSPATGSPYVLDVPSREGGAGEPGWVGPWLAHPAATFQSKVVFEGDGALYLTGSVNTGPNYGRQLAQAQTGTFQVEFYLQVPEGSTFTLYVWQGARGGASTSGPQMTAGSGKFIVGHGNLNGDFSRWIETELPCLPGRWYKVKVRIDVPTRTWEFFLDDKRFPAPHPLNFRAKATYLDYVNFLVAGGVYVDAVRVTRVTGADKKHPP
jgi:hypothetical protein